MNVEGPPATCEPTWRGYVETTKDALLVFEACFQGLLQHCGRRPYDKERGALIVSGNVFVYEEASSGIKRWTDGIPWSPSRILTNFLIYRQLNSPFPSGEKKRATKRTVKTGRQPDDHSPLIPSLSTESTLTSSEPSSTPSVASPVSSSPDLAAHRGLVGSLVDSYEFKENGLLKKTMTVAYRGVQHHLVSYYSLEDARQTLSTPRDDDRLKGLDPRDELLKQPKFKFPNLDDAGDGSFEAIDNVSSPPTRPSGSMSSYPQVPFAFNQPYQPDLLPPAQMAYPRYYEPPNAYNYPYPPAVQYPYPAANDPASQYAAFPPGASPLPPYSEAQSRSFREPHEQYSHSDVQYREGQYRPSAVQHTQMRENQYPQAEYTQRRASQFEAQFSQRRESQYAAQHAENPLQVYQGSPGFRAPPSFDERAGPRRASGQSSTDQAHFPPPQYRGGSWTGSSSGRPSQP